MRKWFLVLTVLALSSVFFAGTVLAAGGNIYYWQAEWGMPSSAQPFYMAADSSGHIYVSQYNGPINKYDENGNLLAQYGGVYTGPMAADSGGDIYLFGNTSSSGSEIFEFDPNFNLLASWTPALPFGPSDVDGLAVDSSDNIYMANTAVYAGTGNFCGGGTVQKYSSSGTLLAQWSGYIVNGVSESFSSASSVAVDSQGNVYVADGCNYRVVKLDPNGNYITQWGSYGPNPGQFYSLSKIEADNIGNLFVLDGSYYMVDKFDLNGNYLTRFNLPWTGDMAVDPSNDDIYVDHDLMKGTVRRWSPNGWITATALYNGAALQNAYLYLQKDSQKGVTPDEMSMLRPAQYPYGDPSATMIGQQFVGINNASASDGSMYVPVPPGKWFVRILKRTGNASVYEPPYPGDYTWFSTPITVPNNGLANLGTVNTYLYNSQQLPTVSGVVNGASSGSPLAGWFVRATVQRCLGRRYANHCGGIYYAAPNRTDANGKYTVTLPGGGTYYIYACPGGGDACKGGKYIEPYRSYNGGYSTCGTIQCMPSGNCESKSYNCPTAVNAGQQLTNENISVPGY
ncbi:MAG: hypothetical protein M0Z75_15405 [Nitrospiraceae bacterium]|nr:hypothetical protein [Nitrospiraceae bacterium]